MAHAGARATAILCCAVLALSHTVHRLDHEHENDGDDRNVHSHHKTIDLHAASWDKVVASDNHVWVVLFHSLLCTSCQAFASEWDSTRSMVDGLHWASVNIDDQDNIALANKFGVLQEGIPNVKLVNAADVPLGIVSGEVPKADQVARSIRETLANAGAAQDLAGYFRSHGRGEL